MSGDSAMKGISLASTELETGTTSRSRNAGRMAEISRPHFDRAHALGLMGVSCRVGHNRRIEITNTGQRVVDYARCGYLNLDSHPKVLAAARSSLEEIGSVHFSVARTRLTAESLARLEQQLSRLFDVQSIIVFPTVAAANMGALPLLAAGLFTNGERPLIAFDRFAHVTLQYHIPVLREETDVVVIEHNDLGRLEQLCRTGRKVTYVGDGAYSMGGAAPVEELRRLQQNYGLFIYLDDAHGISVVGDRGEGFVRSQLSSLSESTIVAASLGKGFGASGGMLMIGSIEHEKTIRRYAPTYAFSCAPNTAAVGAALASADIHETPELNSLQRRLYENLRLFDRLVPTETAESPLPIRIFRVGLEELAIKKAEHLLRMGHYTSAVFFPTVPRGRAALRMAITAAHDPADISDLANLLLSEPGYLADQALRSQAESTRSPSLSASV